MVSLRDLHEISEFQKVIALEHRIWGYTDYADVVTLPVFIISVKRGAILIGAFDETNELVGFVYSIVGMKDGKPMQWSHMAGVVPAYRGRGLGRDLKLAQRVRALEGGFDLIEWTFDPLQAVNAHLNFAKLGVVAEEYAVDIYGESSSALHKGTPTDRLIVQWRIRDPHVERRIQGSKVPEFQDPNVPRFTARAEDVARAPLVNRTATWGAWRENESIDVSLDDRRVWVEIPFGFTEMQQQAPELALRWRLQLRDIFQAYFGRGYRAVDFELRRDIGIGRYLLSS